MDIVTVIYGLLIGCGITCIITRGYIFHGLRESIERRSQSFGTLVNCPQCTGLWIGLLVGAFMVMYGCSAITMIAIMFGTSLLSPWFDPTRGWS